MKKKICSLLLAFALPLTSCSFNLCSASSDPLDDTIKNLQCSITKLEKEKDVKQLQERLQRLEKEKDVEQLQERLQRLEKGNTNKSTSFWAKTKRNFKNFLSTSFGVIGSACAMVGISAIATAAYTLYNAVVECINDDHCHFNDNSFLQKLNFETFKNSFWKLITLLKNILINVHYVYTVNND